MATIEVSLPSIKETKGGGPPPDISHLDLSDGLKNYLKAHETEKLAREIRIKMFVKVVSESDSDLFHTQLQNLDSKDFASQFKQLFVRTDDEALREYETQALKLGEKIPGRFRAEPDNPASPLIPGLIREALIGFFLNLDKKIKEAGNNPTLFAKAIDEFITVQVEKDSDIQPGKAQTAYFLEFPPK